MPQGGAGAAAGAAAGARAERVARPWRADPAVGLGGQRRSACMASAFAGAMHGLRGIWRSLGA